MTSKSHTPIALSDAVTQTLEHYFKTLEGECPSDVYKMVLGQVEKPLVEFILKQTDFNQKKAAEILGINRNTLRKKIQTYHISI